MNVIKDREKKDILHKRGIPLEYFMVDTFFHEDWINCKIKPYLSAPEK